MVMMQEQEWFKEELQRASERAVDTTLPAYARQAAERRLWNLVRNANAEDFGSGAVPFRYAAAMHEGFRNGEKAHFERQRRTTQANQTEDVAREERAAAMHEKSLRQIEARETL